MTKKLSKMSECLIKAEENSALAASATSEQWRTFYRRMEGGWRDLAERYSSSKVPLDDSPPVELWAEASDDHKAPISTVVASNRLTAWLADWKV
jgi:hypothetical protein